MADIEQEARAFKAWAAQVHALNFRTAEFNENPSPEVTRIFRSAPMKNTR